jgi:hypothetical protein
VAWSALQFVMALTAGVDRFDLARRFVEAWHRPLGPDDGVPVEDLDRAEARLGRSLPRALRRWYELAGRERFFPHQLRNTNVLLPPEDLEIRDGVLAFYAHDRAPMAWLLREEDLALADPPVYVDAYLLKASYELVPSELLIENATLSEFLLEMMVHQTIFRAPQLARATGGPELLQLIGDTCQALPLATWRWPAWPTRFLVRDDLLLYASHVVDFGVPDPAVFEVYAAARTDDAMLSLPAEDRVAWEGA